MSTQTTALLKQGKTCTYTLSEGGDLASMRGIFKYGQEITISPVEDFHEVQIGDIVYVQWRGGGYILHPVQEIDGDRFLIVNSLGQVNGWVHGSAILGKVTQLVDPPAHPEVPEMLALLHAAYKRLASRCAATGEEALLLEGIVQDLRWYMERITPARWEKLPRQNRWSFKSNLWYLTKQACEAAEAGDARPITYYIDQGKWIVGFAAEIVALFEEYDWEYLR
jgi:hypothetical protein